MRLFVGIPLAPDTVNSLQKLSARLRAGQDGLRWTPPEAWHVTLQFLGETTTEQYACLLPALQKIEAAPLRITLDAVSTFERAGVIIVTVALSSALLALQGAVTRATTPCGFVPEARPYAPHITLARVRRGSRFRPHFVLQQSMREPLRLPGFVAREFLLYESFPEKGGAHYAVRERFLLAESANRTAN